MGAIAAPVIAAPIGIDQPITEPSENLFRWITLILTAAVAGLLVWRRWYTLRAVPARPEPFLPLESFGIALVFLLLGTLGAQFAARSLGIDFAALDSASLADLVRVRSGAYIVQAFVVAMFWWRWRQVRALPDDDRPSLGRAMFIGVAAMVLLWPAYLSLGWVTTLIFEHVMDYTSDPVAHDTLRTLIEHPRDGWFFAMTALVVVIAPWFEEVLYRGLVQDGIRRAGLGPWASIVLTAILFAAAHATAAPGHALVVLFGLGVAFGWAFERTGRLAVSIVMHAAFNLVNVLLAIV